MPMSEIPVIVAGHVKGERGRLIPRAVGEINVGVLHDRVEVPIREYNNNSGYQRPASQTRVRKLANELKDERVDLPTAILLNIRDFDESRHLRRDSGQTVLAIGATDRFFVVDGQHRFKALDSLVQDSDPDDSRWRTYTVPFVCLLGATEAEEMRQFYVVNSTAKSVSTDLAYDLLRAQAANSPELREAFEESGEAWKLHGQEVADRLKETPPWTGRIRFPAEPKLQTTIPSSGMVNSLRELMRGISPVFQQATIENQVSILAAYWGGILRVLPEAAESPNSYTLQKMTGTVVMHSMLPNVIEILRSRGSSLLDPVAYEEDLREPLEELEGQSRTDELVRGADFWRSGEDGAAGGFSSNAGRRVIRARLMRLLPNVEIR